MGYDSAPNEKPGGDRVHGTMPAGRDANTTDEPNTAGDRRRGTMPTAGPAGAIHPPNAGGLRIGHSSRP